MQPKFFWVAIAAIALAGAADAAPAKKSSRQPAAEQPAGESSSYARAAMMRERLQGLNVYAYYTLADQVNTEGNYYGREFSGEFKSEAAFGIGTHYDFYENQGITLNAGGTYELARNMSRHVGTSKGEKYDLAQDPKPEVQLWTAYAQADYELFPQVHVFAGPNYSFPVVRRVSGGDFKGKIGWQVGGGFNFTQNVAVDGMYRQLNFSGTSDGGWNYDRLTSAGFLGRVRYAF